METGGNKKGPYACYWLEEEWTKGDYPKIERSLTLFIRTCGMCREVYGNKLTLRVKRNIIIIGKRNMMRRVHKNNVN